MLPIPVSLGHDNICANAVGSQGLVLLFPHSSPLSVP